MLQAGIISGYVVSLAIVRDTRPEREAASLIGYISMSMAVAPMIGPMIGGVFDAAFGWRANFFFYAIAGIAILILCMMDLGETRDKPDDNEQQHARSGFRILLKEPLFWCYTVCSASSTGSFYIFLTGAPLVAQAQFGVSTAELGFYIGSITAGFMAGSFVAGKFGPKFKPTTMMLVGRGAASCGLVIGLCFLWVGFLSPVLYFGSTIFVGFGNGLTIPSSNTSAMSIKPKLAGTAAGTSGAIVVAVGAFLSLIAGLMLPTDEPAAPLLWLMIATVLTGLISVLAAVRLSGKERVQ